MEDSWLVARRFRSDCFAAQTDPEFDAPVDGDYPVNTDVGGIAVAISNTTINVALPVLLQWGTADEDAVILVMVMLILQVYPILLSTAATIGRDNDFGLFDAHFAVAVSASPVSIYFAFSAYRALFGSPNHLFLKLSKHRYTFCFFGVLLPVLWLFVNININFNSHAFRNSEKWCSDMTVGMWLEFQIASNLIGVLDVLGRRDLWNDLKGRGGLGTICLVSAWVWAVLLVRHMEDIIGVYRWRRRDYRAQGLAWWKSVARLVWNVVSVPWFVITRSHPWILFVIIVSLHWSYVLGIAKGMIFTGYKLTYGQMTSIFATFPPLLSILKVAKERFGDTKKAVLRFPGAFWAELKFLVAGSADPWKSSEYYDRMTIPTPILSSPRFFLFVCVIWVVATSADVIWMIAYVQAGTIPVKRSLLNNPHEDWKPFSVSLYIFGYCVCMVNILVWTTYFGRGNLGSEVVGSGGGRHRSKIWTCVDVLLAPCAFVMCTAPLFGLIASLPLAQQWQWDHVCDSFPAYAELHGGTEDSFALFYPSRGPAIQYQYTLNTVMDATDTTPTQIWFNWTSGLPPSTPSAPSIMITSISYFNLTGSAKSFSADCYNSTSGLFQNNCGSGSFEVEPYLAFTIIPAGLADATVIRAVDKEWAFIDDAPSLIMAELTSSPTHGDELGETIFQTAVTKRNFCNVLKVCLSLDSLTPDLRMVVPLGVVLWAQARYTSLCQ